MSTENYQLQRRLTTMLFIQVAVVQRNIQVF